MIRKHVIRSLAATGLAGLFVAALFITPTEGALAQARLLIGGARANFGIQRINAGFMPDPHTVNVRSGGSLAVAPMNLGPSCRGHATAQPDYIVQYNGQSPTGILRFYFRANQSGQDATLIINDPQGNWHCDDDGGGNLNPMVTFNRPSAGQYDIWVGSYSDGDYIDGRLSVTELASNRP